MWYEKYLGKPYVFGASGPESYDCLTLILSIAKELHGIHVKVDGLSEDWATKDRDRYWRESLRYGAINAKIDHIGEGSMVFFRLKGNFAEHAGYMVDRDRFIHILDDDFVRIDNLRKHPWKTRFYGGVKIGS